MAGWSALQKLSTPAGDVTFVSPILGTSGLVLDPKSSTGLGTGEVRATIDDQAQESGFILHPEWFEKGAEFVLAGVIRGTDVAERDAFMLDTKTKLRSILSANGTLDWGSHGTIVVRWNLGVDFPHISGILYGFRFGLVSADPW